MNPFLYAGVMVALWVVNLFNGTGLGGVYQTTERARLISYLIITAMLLLLSKKYGGKLYVKRRDFYIYGSLAAFFIIDSYLHGQGWTGLHYMWAFLVTYLVGKLPAHVRGVRLTGIAYAVLGAAILYIFDFRTALSGWNANSIAMIGLHSFLVFLIPFYDAESRKQKIGIALVAVLYMYMIDPTDSRSCIIFTAMAILLALSIIPRKWIIGSDKRYLYFLLAPLVLAFLVVAASHTGFMSALDLWSRSRTNKPLFNGRDVLWERAFQELLHSPLWGTGEIGSAWHNSVMTCLAAYGILGFVFWLRAFLDILSRGRVYIEDTVVTGCIISFIVLYVQQSVELGLIAESPNILPYTILGMMLGRIRQLNMEHARLG